MGKKVSPAVPGGKKPVPNAASKTATKAADKPLGWFDRLKRLRLRFQRKGIDFKLLLEDPAQHIAEIKRQAVAVSTSEAEVMSRALKLVLDRHASARTVLAHLAVLEKALRRRGLKALDELPPEVMLRAMSQLETLVTDWSPAGLAGLAGLRARVTGALVRHDRASQHGGAPERPSNFQDSNRVQVGEVSVSTFLEVSAQWEESLKGSLRLSVPQVK